MSFLHIRIQIFDADFGYDALLWVRLPIAEFVAARALAAGALVPLTHRKWPTARGAEPHLKVEFIPAFEPSPKRPAGDGAVVEFLQRGLNGAEVDAGVRQLAGFRSHLVEWTGKTGRSACLFACHALLKVFCPYKESELDWMAHRI